MQCEGQSKALCGSIEAVMGSSQTGRGSILQW
jgi:hypothetical protein